MPDEAAETIITRFVIEASEMIKGTIQIREQIDKTKVALKAAAEANKESFKVTVTGMKEAFRAANTWTNATGKVLRDSKAIRQFNIVMAHSLREVEKAERKAAAAIRQRAIEQEKAAKATKKSVQSTKEATSSTKLFGMELGRLGDVGKFVFGSILGLSAVVAIRKIIELFKSAAGEVIGFSQELFKLGASTRALQRSGLDITIADVSEKITELREEFGVFSRRDIASGLAQIQLYTRQLGFTVEQMDDMIDAVSTLSIVMGKDFGETARSVALFLSSGYGEALQRAGIVDANRASVAQELLALGFKKSFNEATQQERALAGLSIIMRGVADISEETAGFQDTLAGKVSKLDAAWQDLLLVLGQELPISGSIVVLTELVENAIKLVEELKVGWLALVAVFAIPLLAFRLLFEAVRKFFEFVTGRKIEIEFEIPEFFKKGEDELNARMKDIGKDAIKKLKEGMEEEIDFTDIMDEIADEMEDEGERLQNRLEKIGRDVANDLDRIARDALNRIAAIGRDYAQKLIDIARKLEQQIADAQRRAAIRAAQIIRQANLRRDDINRKYRERELKAERDFQEAMRRLREDFLLDLEDALRERDALQVLRLTKRFNLEQDRLQREREEEKGDLERQRQEELRDLERQTQERLRVLQEELAARLETLRINAQRERDEALLNLQRKIDEEGIAEERRKKERKIREEEQIAEEKKRSEERLAAYAQELADREGLTAEAVDALLILLKDTYGEGGLVQGVIGGLEQALLEANAAVAESARVMAQEIMRAIAQIRALNNMSISQPSSSPTGPGRAEGGTVIASKPTTVTFGEAGLEAATFTPLTRMGRDEGKVFGEGLPSFGGKGSGKLALDIMLSKGLEAQIIESALDEVADVIVNVQRKR